MGRLGVRGYPRINVGPAKRAALLAKNARWTGPGFFPLRKAGQTATIGQVSSRRHKASPIGPIPAKTTVGTVNRRPRRCSTNADIYRVGYDSRVAKREYEAAGCDSCRYCRCPVAQSDDRIETDTPAVVRADSLSIVARREKGSKRVQRVRD